MTSTATSIRSENVVLPSFYAQFGQARAFGCKEQRTNKIFSYEIKNMNTSPPEHITSLLLRSRKSIYTSTENILKSIAALLWDLLSLQVRLVILIRLHATHRYKRSCHYGKGSIMTLILFSNSSQYYHSTSLHYKYYIKLHVNGHSLPPPVNKFLALDETKGLLRHYLLTYLLHGAESFLRS